MHVLVGTARLLVWAVLVLALGLFAGVLAPAAAW